MTDEIKAKIPKQNVDLEKLGLINQGLFLVDKNLAQRYNHVLKEIFGYECGVDSFRIDKRGLSPELSIFLKKKYSGDDRLEYGENYLNMRSANRFMLIVSPDQRDAPLIAPQTSYDDQLCNRVHDQARHTIEDITQSEALFGELENKISMYESADDLLHVKTIEINLDTLNETVNSVFQLRKISDNLGAGDNALNPEYIGKMKKLVKKVGDIRYRPISNIFPIKKEIHCFYAEFFNGLHCLRNFNRNQKVRTIFVSHHQRNLSSKDLGPEIIALDLHSPELINVLSKHGFLKYDQKLVEQRIQEVEDELLLEKGIDVVDLRESERKRKITQLHKNFPKTYRELLDIQKKSTNKRARIDNLVKNKSYETKVMLSAPKNKKEIIGHMLAELDPTDPVRLYQDNRKKLITEFSSLPLNRQRYIAFRLLNFKFNGGK